MTGNTEMQQNARRLEKRKQQAQGKSTDESSKTDLKTGLKYKPN